MQVQEPSDVMSRLKKDWNDLAARSQVSEVGLDVDRAELIRRYREEEGLTQRQIADGLGLGQQHISCLLLYGRYIASTADSRTRISESLFRQYWKQVSDPRMTKGRRKIDTEYEAACFADIRKLVEAGKPPSKKRKREKPLQARDIKGVAEVHKAARRVYSELQPELKRLKRLLNADRSTYAPALLAQSAVVIDRKIRELFKVLADASEDSPEHGEPVAASAGN